MVDLDVLVQVSLQCVLAVAALVGTVEHLDRLLVGRGQMLTEEIRPGEHLVAVRTHILVMLVFFGDMFAQFLSREEGFIALMALFGGVRCQVDLELVGKAKFEVADAADVAFLDLFRLFRPLISADVLLEEGLFREGLLALFTAVAVRIFVRCPQMSGETQRTLENRRALVAGKALALVVRLNVPRQVNLSRVGGVAALVVTDERSLSGV